MDKLVMACGQALALVGTSATAAAGQGKSNENYSRRVS